MKIEKFIKHDSNCLAGKYTTMGRCSCGAQAAFEELAALREAAQLKRATYETTCTYFECENQAVFNGFCINHKHRYFATKEDA